jgi:hypothetical protein
VRACNDVLPCHDVPTTPTPPRSAMVNDGWQSMSVDTHIWPTFSDSLFTILLTTMINIYN